MPDNTDWQRICVITEYIGVDWIDVEVDLQRAVEGDLLRTSVRGIDYVDVHSMSPHRPSMPDVEAAAHVIRLGLQARAPSSGEGDRGRSPDDWRGQGAE